MDIECELLSLQAKMDQILALLSGNHTTMPPSDYISPAREQRIRQMARDNMAAIAAKKARARK